MKQDEAGTNMMSLTPAQFSQWLTLAGAEQPGVKPVLLDVRWTLRNKFNDVLARGIFVDEEPVPGKGYDVLTATESRLVQKMAEHLAGRLPTLTGGKR